MSMKFTITEYTGQLTIPAPAKSTVNTHLSTTISNSILCLHHGFPSNCYLVSGFRWRLWYFL